MAKPYKEGQTWSIRRRIHGHDIYVSRQASAAAALKAMAKKVHSLEQAGQAKGFGPERTTLAQAFQDYGLERLPFMKGARQEANRQNKYLRAVGLATLKAKDIDAATSSASDTAKTTAYCVIVLEPHQPARVVPTGLADHRRQQNADTAKSDKARARLAAMKTADVCRHHVQELMDALRGRWCERCKHPPGALFAALTTCRNKEVPHVIALLLETAMRSSEPLTAALWKDVDWERKVLKLTDAKAGGREVPLSPHALQVLHQLQSLHPSRTRDERIVSITYESLKAAWTRACARAGIEGLNLHDLRHTAATRLALTTGANVFLVQALTGHKTLSMLERYVHVSARDVVEVLHRAPVRVEKAIEAPPAAPPQCLHVGAISIAPERPRPVSPIPSGNVVHVRFGRQA